MTGVYKLFIDKNQNGFRKEVQVKNSRRLLNYNWLVLGVKISEVFSFLKTGFGSGEKVKQIIKICGLQNKIISMMASAQSSQVGFLLQD